MSLCRYVVALLHHIAPLCAHPPNLVVGFGVKLVMTCDAYDDDANDEDNRMTMLTTCFSSVAKACRCRFLTERAVQASRCRGGRGPRACLAQP